MSKHIGKGRKKKWSTGPAISKPKNRAAGGERQHPTLEDLQRAIGNRRTGEMVHQLLGPPALAAGRTLQRRLFLQGLLTPAQEAASIAYNRQRYDLRSIMIMQHIGGVGRDGDFGPATAQAVAAFQSARPPLLVDGKAGENTLNVMVADRVGAGRHDHAIQLVIDFFNLDVTGDTLSVAFDPGLAAAFNTDFESGNLRVISVGPGAFTGAQDLRTAIQAGLTAPAPAILASGPRPSFLSNEEERAATRFNRRHFTDPRSAYIIQGLVDSPPDGAFGGDTAERVADYQDTSGLGVDGMVGEQTLREMVDDLDILGEQNAAIRLIMDFYNLSDFGALLNIRFDTTIGGATNATTSGILPGPSEVRIGPNAFAQGFEGLVHTIAHELEHVRQRKAGIMSSNVREFLGEAVEIMSVGMPEESIAGFMNDASRAVNRFNAMTAAEQREHWERFEEVRDQVRARFNAASAADQAAHQATLDAYNAVSEPAAGP